MKKLRILEINKKSHWLELTALYLIISCFSLKLDNKLRFFISGNMEVILLPNYLEYLAFNYSGTDFKF